MAERDEARDMNGRVYEPPVAVEVGSFRSATRGLTQIDLEMRFGKKAE